MRAKVRRYTLHLELRGKFSFHFQFSHRRIVDPFSLPQFIANEKFIFELCSLLRALRFPLHRPVARTTCLVLMQLLNLFLVILFSSLSRYTYTVINGNVDNTCNLLIVVADSRFVSTTRYPTECYASPFSTIFIYHMKFLPSRTKILLLRILRFLRINGKLCHDQIQMTRIHI